MVVNGGSNPKYSATGYLLFTRGATLYSVPYDPADDAVLGPERELIDGVLTEGYGAAHYTIGGDGILAFVAGDAVSTERDLIWVNRSGEVEEVVLSGRDFVTPRLSPDGLQVVVTVVEGANPDLWVLDLTRGAFTRRTTHQGEDFDLAWGPDGTVLAFASEIGQDDGEVGPAMAWVADSGDEPAQLYSSPMISHWEFPSSWSPDGEWIAFTARRSGRKADVFVLPTAEPREPVSFVETPSSEWAPMFSPGGDWIAYVSDESGQDEIYVRPFPGPGPATLISTDGGVEPLWSKDGLELFYRSGDRMMVVEMMPGEAVAPAVPRELFSGPFERRTLGGEFANYDVSADGRRFLMVRRSRMVQPNVIEVVLDWPTVLLESGDESDGR